MAKLKLRFNTDLILFIISAFIIILQIKTYVFPTILRVDFGIYYDATKAMLANQNIYGMLLDGITFNYPPSLFLLIFPFTLFPKIYAVSIWNLIGIILFLSSGILFFKKFLSEITFSKKLFLISIFFLISPIQETLLFGQINIYVLFLCLSSFFLFEKNNRRMDVLAGLSLGLASGLKIIPLFLLIYLLLRKKWLGIIIASLSFMLFNFAGSLGNFNHFYEFIKYISATVVLPSLGSSTEFTTLLSSFSILSVIFITLWATYNYFKEIKKSKEKGIVRFELFSILFATSILFFPFADALNHHFVFLIPLIWLSFYKFAKKKSLLSFFVFTTLFCLTASQNNDILIPFLIIFIWLCFSTTKLL